MAKSSFVERNKAVREAWNKELELVQEGKGTREWTPEQQKDILEKGRAYDEKGKAFEGQHMKSAEMYPEYQGEPEIYNSLQEQNILRRMMAIGKIQRTGIIIRLQKKSLILEMDHSCHVK